MSISSTNYKEAWTTLVKRYDNKRVLLAAHMRKLLSCPSASKKSVDEILRLLDATNESIRAFSNMNRPVDQWDDWFVHLLVHKLDPQTREDWETSLKDLEDFPTFRELSTFLESRVRALEAARPIDCSSASSSAKNSTNHSSQKSKKQNLSVNLATSEKQNKPSNSCSICQGSHFISYCPRFKGLGTSQRIENVQRLGLCFNCLRGNHAINSCPSSKRCFVCSEKHHTFVHVDTHRKNDQVVKTDSLTEQPSSSGYSESASNASALVNHLTSKPERNNTNSVFATAYIKLSSFNGNSILVKGFLDSGSERSFITERVVQHLEIPKQHCDISLTGMGDSPLGSSSYQADLLLRSPRDSKFELPMQALVMKSLIHLLPKKRFEFRDWPHLRNLELADPDYHRQVHVDCVIGVDLFGHVLRDGLKQGPLNSPTALNTCFGWVVFGRPVILQKDNTIDSASVLHAVENYSLSNQLRLFWELEEIPKRTFLKKEEEDCELLFKDNHYRNSSGRYVVRLPLLGSPNDLGESRRTAVSVFLRNEKRFSKDPQARAAYNEFMIEYLTLNHMRPVNNQDLQVENCYYLPHHVIFKKNGPSAKIRVVFNGSSRSNSGTSLNDLMHSGQKLQTDIWLIVTRWRLFKYVFTADIVKMFRQINVDDVDCNLQRIVWRPEPNKDLQDYCLTTVTYGTRSAPFLAIRTLNQLASDEQQRFPLGSEILNKNTYVDDIFTGGDSVQSAEVKRKELISILNSAGITLSKWAANSPELLPESCGSHSNQDKTFEIDDSVSTLGLKWSTSSDCFHFSVSVSKEPTTYTKRTVASEVARLFDPLGWLAPLLIRAKIFLQNLWISGLDWDSALTEDLLSEWNTFRQQLNTIEEIRIPRWLGTSDGAAPSELHGFSDASQRAYSAAVYLVSRSTSGTLQSNLIIAKTKVAPIKTVTLPKLELCGAELLAKLLDAVSSNLGFRDVPKYCWCDAQIVIDWLQGHPSRWPTFVANRVGEIHSTLKDQVWRHVPTKFNPADCATRGFDSNELKNSSLWWHGPNWLTETPSNWPQTMARPIKVVVQETQEILGTSKMNTRVNLATLSYIQNLPSRYSSFQKLIRVTAYIYRFRTLCSANSKSVAPYLTTEELTKSLNFWLKYVQLRHFQAECMTLQNEKKISGKSELLKLHPFLDGNGILRVGGRLQNSLLSFDEKHPIILPKRDQLSYLIVLQAHTLTLHGGQQLTLSHLLRRFWIIGAKVLINTVIRSCVTCERFRARTPTQLMGQLPTDRVSESRPFACSGVDYAGPYNLRASPGRGIKTYKGYICLFICLSTRAIHLEVVSGYTSTAFLAAFRRFISRRGACSRLYSDNGTTFTGADRELRFLLRGATRITTKVAEDLANQGTTWSFIPPNAPHFGGIWEAGVKSVKHHLRRSISADGCLTFEEMSTVLCQIEACLNSRPLYPNPNDPSSMNAITPGHFLTGGPMTAVPEPSLIDVDDRALTRWALISKMRDNFWKRWSHEYLHHLQQRSKWLVETKQVKVGDIVLLKEEKLPPAKWSLARIEELHPGNDGLVRVVTIRTSKGIYKRGLNQLALLPVQTTSSI